MNRRETLMAALAAAALALGLVPAHAEDAVTVTIGKLLELTGPLSETGPSQDKAVTIAIDYANQTAAAAGVPVKASAVSADAQGDPQAALSAARALVAKGASAIIGPSITPESIAVANGLTIQKRISVWPTGTSMRLRTIKDEGTIFRTVPPDSLQAYALAEAVADKLGDPKGKLLSIAYRNEPYGEGLARDLKAAWTAKGGRVQGPVVFDPAQATFDSEAEQVVGNNPDAYVVIDYPDTFAKFGASLVRTGKYDPTKLFVPDALALSTVPSNIPAPALEGAHGTRGGSDISTDAYKLFDELWRKAGGVEHFSLDANSFDATILVILAAAAAHSSDPAAITAKIRDVAKPGATKFGPTNLGEAMKAAWSGKPIDYVGVAGAFEFADNGDPTISRFDIYEYKAGKLDVIKQIDASK
jgi:ABC-type branched-subunit amino acid transport system substrate-binding protein